MSDPETQKMIDEASAAMANQHADSLRMMEKEVDAYRQAKIKRIWTVIIVIALIVVAFMVFS